MLKRSSFLVLALVVSVLLAGQPLQAAHAQDIVQGEEDKPHVVIYQLQMIAQHNAFIDLYNPTDKPIDMSDWRLQQKHKDGTWRDRISAGQDDVERIIAPHSFFSLGTNAYMDQTDAELDIRINWPTSPAPGLVRLLKPVADSDELWDEVDIIHWGFLLDEDSDTSEALQMPDADEAIARCFYSPNSAIDIMQAELSSWQQIVTDPLPKVAYICPQDDVVIAEDSEPEPQDDSSDEVEGDPGSTEENGAGDSVVDETEATNDEKTEDQNGEAVDIPNETPSDLDEKEQDTNQPLEACKFLTVSEVLPNPQGPRSEFPREDNAYIELYNTADEPIELHGCGLQTSASQSAFYWFTEASVLEPESFKLLYERESGIRLPVAPSGTVFIVDENEHEFQAITYPADMPEAAAWAWFGNDSWDITYSPTPGTVNELLAERPLEPCPEGQERNPETNRCRNIPQPQTLAACPEGQERNPETNRCRSISQASRELVPCGPNQERNPETNRCRNVQASIRELVPCGPGQERNPETNRCRSVQSAASTLGPCPEGQERNPETNRCRTVAAPNSEVKSVQDIAVASESDMGHWLLAGSMVGFAFVYGTWEWRYEALRWGRGIRSLGSKLLSLR